MARPAGEKASPLKAWQCGDGQAATGKFHHALRAADALDAEGDARAGRYSAAACARSAHSRGGDSCETKATPKTMKSPTTRAAHVRLKKAKGRKESSRRWIERQLNDPYVREAKAKGYRSRAAFKLVELDDKFHFLKPGARVLDLGAAPGGWSQVAAKRVSAKGTVVAGDILEIAPLPGVSILQADISESDSLTRLQQALG